MKSSQPATQARLALVTQLPTLAMASSGRALRVTSGSQETGCANRNFAVWSLGEIAPAGAAGFHPSVALLTTTRPRTGGLNRVLRVRTSADRRSPSLCSSTERSEGSFDEFTSVALAFLGTSWSLDTKMKSARDLYATHEEDFHLLDPRPHFMGVADQGDPLPLGQVPHTASSLQYLGKARTLQISRKSLLSPTS